jgi:hypothetical protein
MTKNIPAILNAFALAILYLVVLGDKLNFISSQFDIILIPILIMGFGVEIYFLIRSLVK